MKYFFALLFFIFSINTSYAQQAPEFSLPTESGEQIALHDFKGKPVVIHFWATWCPYCKKLQPTLDNLSKKYQDKGVNFIAISLWEDEGATPQQVINERGFSFQTAINGDSIAEKYNVKGTPTTIFINKSGEIIWATGLSDPTSPKWEQAFKAITK